MKTHSRLLLIFLLLFFVCAFFLACGSEVDRHDNDSAESDDDIADDDAAGDDDDSGDDDSGDDDSGDDDDDSGDDDSGGDDDDSGDDDSGDDDDDIVETITIIDDLTIVRLKGNAYDRGYQLGVALGEQIVFMYQEYMLNYVLDLGPEFAFLFPIMRSLAGLILDIDPEEKDQMRGIVDAILDNYDGTLVLSDGSEMQLNYYDIYVANVIADFGQIACSSLSVWGSLTDDGQTLLARNLDWDPGPDNMLGDCGVVMSETPEDESWQLVSIGWPGLIGCYSCINGDGDAIFVHDTSRYNSNIVLHVQPRSFLLRKGILAAQGASDKLAAVEDVFEAGNVDTGNNFHFVSADDEDRRTIPAGCFEIDDNPNHPDGVATLRTSLDTDVSGTSRTEALFVTNHYRKRYKPGSCWRYDRLIEAVDTLVDHTDPGNPSGDSVIDADDLHWAITEVEFPTLTAHTVIYKPATKYLQVFRIGPDHLASEDQGVVIPWDVLFPW